MAAMILRDNSVGKRILVSVYSQKSLSVANVTNVAGVTNELTSLY
jgi:hypothetical protein